MSFAPCQTNRIKGSLSRPSPKWQNLGSLRSRNFGSLSSGIPSRANQGLHISATSAGHATGTVEPTFSVTGRKGASARVCTRGYLWWAEQWKVALGGHHLPSSLSGPRFTAARPKCSHTAAATLLLWQPNLCHLCYRSFLITKGCLNKLVYFHNWFLSFD